MTTLTMSHSYCSSAARSLNWTQGGRGSRSSLEPDAWCVCMRSLRVRTFLTQRRSTMARSEIAHAATISPSISPPAPARNNAVWNCNRSAAPLPSTDATVLLHTYIVKRRLRTRTSLGTIPDRYSTTPSSVFTRLPDCTITLELQYLLCIPECILYCKCRANEDNM